MAALSPSIKRSANLARTTLCTRPHEDIGYSVLCQGFPNFSYIFNLQPAKYTCSGCSLGIGDRRVLRLLHWILRLIFACFLQELCPSIILLLFLYCVRLLLQFLMKSLPADICFQIYIIWCLCNLAWHSLHLHFHQYEIVSYLKWVEHKNFYKRGIAFRMMKNDIHFILISILGCGVIQDFDLCK